MDSVTRDENVSKGQVTKEVQRQANLAGELNELADKFEAKLTPVVMPPPKLEPTSEPERVTVVALAGQIESSNDLVERCLKMLVQLLDRIEL